MEGLLRLERVMGRELVIYLPPSYEAENRRFPVVYLQDEGNVMKHTLNYLEHLFNTKQLPELIFVGIKPHDRNHDYTPWPALAVMTGAASFGGGGQNYLNELVQHIKPFVDTKYLSLSEPEHTGIIGYSLGGLISLYACYQYPEVFGRIGLLSASFWYEGMIEYMRTEPIERSGHRIYMYVGALEGLYKHNIQKGMVEQTHKAFAVLQDQGFNETEMKFEFDSNGTHDNVFFSQRFPVALRWLFGAEASSGDVE